MNLKSLVLAIIFCTATAYADPQITAWLTNYSAQYARAYTNTSKRTGGNSVTTWGTSTTGQGVVSYTDVGFIGYSASWVYVRASDLPSYVIGPWLNPQGQPGSLFPTNQHVLNRFPRTTSAKSGTKTTTGTGYSGLFVNGVAAFNFADGKAYDGSSAVQGPHTQSTYYWHRCAPVAEDYNFDYPLGHQTPSGVYHNHQQPIALRYQLGDHVDYNSSTKNYSEGTNSVTSHSPILGYAYDGYPIYGPYGYSVTNDANSGIRRMVSGYVARNGQNGTDNLSTNLSVIPAWYARFRQSHFGGVYSTTAGTSRSSTSTDTLGTYAQDYSYYGDLTNSATGQKYVAGTNTFDLDEYNGRWCVTPEYPGGTYAYFLTIDSSGNSVYPYAFAFEYYGTVSGGSVSSISESITTNFIGSADSKLTLSTPSINTSNYLVTLVWSSTEGGKYQVESSTDQSSWTVEKTNVSATVGVSTTNTYTTTTTNGTVYVRLTRTSLATYDDIGFESGVVGQTNVQSFLIGNDAPVVANAIPNQTNTYGSSFSYTFPTNTFSDVNSGQTLTYTASSSALTNTGISFNSATRTFSASTVYATNGGTIVGSYTVQVVATDNGSPAKSATNSFSLVINKAAASVTANSFSRAYGVTNPVFTGTLTNFVALDSISAAYSCSATTNSAVGSYPITPSLTDTKSVLGNYTVTTNAGTLTVSKAPLTVLASSLSRVYGSTNPTFSATYSGFTNGQTLATSGVSGSPALTTTALTNSNVGSYVISNALGTLSATNYSFTLVNGTLTVTQVALTISASNATRVYGATNPTMTGTISGLVNNDNIAATFSSVATTNSIPGTYNILPTITDPSGKLGNYSVTTNTGTLTVTKALLSVTANNASRAYGSANPTFTTSYSGFANNETSSSGTISGSASLTSAGTNAPIGNYTITNALGTLVSSYYNFTLTNGTLTVTQATLVVTPDNVSRRYGQTNPVLTGTISGIVNNDNISATYSTTATTNSAIGTYPITATLSDPGSVLGNYSVTLNQGTLTVTNASAGSYSTISLNASNSLVALAAAGTTNLIFTDTNNGLSLVIALTMSPYSLSNASPSFTFLDTYGPNGARVHLGVDSGLSGGDGNWMNYFEGANFSASLVSADSGINTNSIQFGITQIGVRPSDGCIVKWTSSSSTNSFTPNEETLFNTDTNLFSLHGTTYSGTLGQIGSIGSQCQLSDPDTTGYHGIVVKAYFTEGTATAPTLASPTVLGNQLQFVVSGSSGASYIVEASTNLSSSLWTPVLTNTAPFTFTNTDTASSTQLYYRVRTQ